MSRESKGRADRFPYSKSVMGRVPVPVEEIKSKTITGSRGVSTSNYSHLDSCPDGIAWAPRGQHEDAVLEFACVDTLLFPCKFITPLYPSYQVVEGAGGGVETSHGSLTNRGNVNRPNNDIVTGGRARSEEVFLLASYVYF